MCILNIACIWFIIVYFPVAVFGTADGTIVLPCVGLRGSIYFQIVLLRSSENIQNSKQTARGQQIHYTWAVFL